MESQGKLPGQAQMRRETPSDVHSQGATNFLEETGTHVKNMAQGAADVGMGAAQGAVSLARGAAAGAANIAQGAADVVKNTIGANDTTTTTGPRGAGNNNNNNNNNNDIPNLMDSHIDVEGLRYAGSMTGDSHFPSDSNYSPPNKH